MRPVINPSLGPGPKFAIKYIPLPKPTKRTDIIVRKYRLITDEGGSKKCI